MLLPETWNEARSVMARAVPGDLRALIGGGSVKLRTRHLLKNVCYTTSNCHAGDSQIFFRPRGDRQVQCQPGIIKYIYMLRNEYFYAIQRVLPSTGEMDHYAVYQDFPAKLYSNRLGPLEKICPSWIESQFLLWKEDEHHSIIIPLMVGSFTDQALTH